MPNSVALVSLFLLYFIKRSELSEESTSSGWKICAFPVAVMSFLWQSVTWDSIVGVCILFFLLHILYFRFPQMRYLWNFSIEKRNEIRVSRCSRKLFEKEVLFIIPFIPFSWLCN